MYQQITDEADVEVGQLISLVLDLGSCSVGLPSPHNQGELSSTALASSPLAPKSKGRGRSPVFTWYHFLM